jgi:hypothetical protein
MVSSILFFWDVTACSLVGSYQDFRRNLLPLFIRFPEDGGQQFIYQTIRRHIKDDCNLNIHHSENIRSLLVFGGVFDDFLLFLVVYVTDE